MPLEKFLILIAGIAIFAILFDISPLLAAVASLSYYIFMFYIKFDFSNLYYFKKYDFRLGSKNANIEFLKDENLYCKYGDTIFSVIEINNQELYTDSNKKLFFQAYNELLSGIGSNIAIITKYVEMPKPYDAGNRTLIYYRTFLILKVKAHSFNSAITMIKNDLNRIKSLRGIKFRMVTDESLIKSFFYDNINVKKHYFMSENLYGAIIDLKDLNYSGDYFYELLIESMGFPIEINLTLSHINNIANMLARMKAARIAEIKSEKNRNNGTVENQVKDIGYLARCDHLYNSYMRFTVLASHPVELKSRVDNFMKNMQFHGISTSNWDFFNSDTFNPLKLEKQGTKYMLDAASLSEIMPVSFTEIPEGPGFLAGINSTTTMPAYIDIFKSTSYNVTITGETGSGKSFFAGMLYRKTKNVQSVFIIDPLNEYNSGQAVNLTVGEYLDFQVSSEGQLDFIAMMVSSLSGKRLEIQIRKFIKELYLEDKNIKFSSILQSIIKKYEKSEYFSEINYIVATKFKNPV
ncbi:MAG: DUF87 domain-containing protein, partial [Ferroplasma sp.]